MHYLCEIFKPILNDFYWFMMSSRWPGEDDFAISSQFVSSQSSSRCVERIIYMNNCVFHSSKKNDLIWLLVEYKHALVNNISMVSESTTTNDLLWLVSVDLRCEWFASFFFCFTLHSAIPHDLRLSRHYANVFLCQVQTKPTSIGSLWF